MSTDIAAREAAPEPLRIGSFVSRGPSALGDASMPIPVVGAEGSPFAGRNGVAHQVTIAESADATISTEIQLAKLRHLSHPVFSPVLECGLAGMTAFWVHGVPDGDPLSQATASDQSWSSIAGVRKLVDTIGRALQIAHDIGLSHGAINQDSIFIDSTSKPILTGFGIDGKGFSRDQADLALVAIELLGGRSWVEPPGAMDDVAGPDVSRAQRVRDFLDGCTERVAAVLARATDLDPADRYPSMAEFVTQFEEAIRFSADELVEAAFQARAMSPDMARLIADKAAAYDPANENLKLLKMQLGGGSPFGPSAGSTLLDPRSAAPLDPLRLSVPVVEPHRAPISHLPAELTEGLPPEFLETIAPQFAVKPVKKGMHPLFVLMMGVVGLILLLAVAGVATFVLGGN
jgi:hypothetical protein